MYKNQSRINEVLIFLKYIIKVYKEHLLSGKYERQDHNISDTGRQINIPCYLKHPAKQITRKLFHSINKYKRTNNPIKLKKYWEIRNKNHTKENPLNPQQVGTKIAASTGYPIKWQPQ